MWKKLLFSSLLLIAVSFVVLDALFGIVLKRGERVTVPDFCGANETLLAADERFSVTAEYRYDESPAGTILSQEPPAGSVRKIGEDRERCQVRVVVSMGPETIALPDLTGENGKVAATELRNRGFSVELLTDPAASLSVAGKVTRMEPPAGSFLVTGSAVRLYVSSGLSEAEPEE